ncbi:MAG TPA: flagellar hook capping FlgD N-terminal domain-containing protein [Xanthobacteraceae bacterium]|nr:flagellar hook capping FlgD N-terminal domain-containing protein [Xanthobacteraceae bacterium]
MTTITNGVGTTSSSTGTATSAQTLASNFTTFLQLLTTQLKNQNPLDPLDTNQFTQQLVQFAQVEQQMKGNDLLSTMTLLQNASLATGALNFVGAKVEIDGNVANLSDNSARWAYTSSRNATATFNIEDKSGQVVYTETRTVNPGSAEFLWNGLTSNGSQAPDGPYTLKITAKDTAGQSVAVSTEIEGTVDSVDLTQNPPILSIGGNTFALDKIRKVIRGANG